MKMKFYAHELRKLILQKYPYYPKRSVIQCNPIKFQGCFSQKQKKNSAKICKKHKRSQMGKGF